MYTVEVNYPNLTKGELVTVDGIGALRNGEVEEIGPEQADAFRSYHQIWDEEKGTHVPGPTLLQAFESSAFVTVKTKKARPANQEGGSN